MLNVMILESVYIMTKFVMVKMTVRMDLMKKTVVRMWHTYMPAYVCTFITINFCMSINLLDTNDCGFDRNLYSKPNEDVYSTFE